MCLGPSSTYFNWCLLMTELMSCLLIDSLLCSAQWDKEWFNKVIECFHLDWVPSGWLDWVGTKVGCAWVCLLTGLLSVVRWSDGSTCIWWRTDYDSCCFTLVLMFLFPDLLSRLKLELVLRLRSFWDEVEPDKLVVHGFRSDVFVSGFDLVRVVCVCKCSVNQGSVC